MTFDHAIEMFIAEMKAEGRIASPHTEASYRSRLGVLREDVSNRSPHAVGVGDIDKTLARWPNPSTGQHARSIYISFFDWALHKRIRKDNPARATRPRKVRKPNVYRLSRAEVAALFDACETAREARVIYIGCLAGLRNAELCGLQLRHFKRAGAVWVSPDIAKGGRQRFIPVLPELEPIVADIIENVGEDDYVIAGRRPVGGYSPNTWREVPTLAASPFALRRIVSDVAQRAGIAAHIHPHLLRHAFGDHVTRHAGLKAAQATLGHASSATTSSTYTGVPTLDELTAALAFFRFAEADREVPRLPPSTTSHPPRASAERSIRCGPGSSAVGADSEKEPPCPNC